MQNQDFTPVAGEPYTLEPNLDLVLAPNPSPMTYLGTNTYVLGGSTLAVIDPGPASDEHLSTLLRVIDGRPVSHIIITHSHLDHSPLAYPLSEKTGARVLAFGDSLAGRSTVMQKLSNAGFSGGGEGMDWDFAPDALLRHGDVIQGQDWSIEAIHTPGHIGNHLCLKWGDVIFTGDHVMGWSTSLVSPPDGDMTDFMTSCATLSRYAARVYYPGHGAPIAAPKVRLEALVTHRKNRSDQILTALKALGPSDVTTLTKQVYADVSTNLYPAAARNVFAHLVDLHQTGFITAHPELSQSATFVFDGQKPGKS